MTTLNSNMSKAEIYLGVVDILHDMFEIEKSKITPQSNLYSELDIDSIDAVDMVVKLNQITNKRIQPDVFRTVRTVQDVVDVLASLLTEDAK